MDNGNLEDNNKKIKTIKIIGGILLIFFGLFLQSLANYSIDNLSKQYLSCNGSLSIIFGIVCLFGKLKNNKLEDMNINNKIFGYKGIIRKKEYLYNNLIYIFIFLFSWLLCLLTDYKNSTLIAILGNISGIIYICSIFNDKRRLSDIRGNSKSSLLHSILLSFYMFPFAKIIGIIILCCMQSKYYNRITSEEKYSDGIFNKEINFQGIKQKLSTFKNKITSINSENINAMFKEGGIMRTPIAIFIMSCLLIWILFNLFGYDRHVEKDGYRCYNIITTNKITHHTTIKSVCEKMSKY